MKKKFWIIGIVVAVLAVAAVGVWAENAKEESADSGAEKPGENKVENSIESGENREEEQVDREKEKEDKVVEEKEAKYISAEGYLVGHIDSHSVEIEVEGKPKAFALSDELREKEMASGDISFKYYVDDNGRSVITSADFQEPRKSEVHTAEGIFSGLADNHTAEIVIQGEPRAFGLDKNITFTGIKEGEEIFIAYQENENGRNVIIKVEKIF